MWPRRARGTHDNVAHDGCNSAAGLFVFTGGGEPDNGVVEDQADEPNRAHDRHETERLTPASLVLSVLRPEHGHQEPGVVRSNLTSNYDRSEATETHRFRDAYCEMTRETFSKSVPLPVSADTAFNWHSRTGAIDRLIPPWESVEVIDRGDGIHDGSRVVLSNRLGPLHLKWVAEHFDCRPGEQFRDIQRQGPFTHWDHTHRFEPDGSDRSILEDHIEYRVPGGLFGRLVAGGFIQEKISRMFEYRHRTTVDDLTAHAEFAETDRLNIAVTGSQGLVGNELIPFLTTGDHKVTRMVRGNAADDDVLWNPVADSFDASAIDGVDAVVHLAGENIAARRWNARQKATIRDSRVHSTRVLCDGLAKMASPPGVLVCASAIGFYGERGDEVMAEGSPAGTGFLAGVAREWEDAAQPAIDAGIRVVHLRFGMILSPKNGALAKMLLPFKLGAGGIVGNGRQYWSWIALDNAVGVIHHALMNDSLSGPVNAVEPNALTNAQFSRTLGRVLSRPTIAPLPGFAARLILGEMADSLLLTSVRVEPAKLIDSGYRFRHADLESALRHMLGRN